MDEQMAIMAAIGDVLDRKKWLDSSVMQQELAGFNPSEVHTIAAIAVAGALNVTALAKQLYVTRGAITKVMTKLIKKGCVERFQKPDNRKERFYRLTAAGQAVAAKHAHLDAEFAARDAAVFAKLTPAQCTAVLDFFQSYASHLDQQIAQNGGAPAEV